MEGKGRPAKAKTFQDLQVWQKSHQLVLKVYRLTVAFPQNELFGLVSQVRRSAVSVPGNIAEGFKRKGRADKARFFNISQASLEETRYYLILADDLGYCDAGEALGQLDEVARMLDGYLKGLKL